MTYPEDGLIDIAKAYGIGVYELDFNGLDENAGISGVVQYLDEFWPHDSPRSLICKLVDSLREQRNFLLLHHCYLVNLLDHRARGYHVNIYLAEAFSKAFPNNCFDRE